MYSPRICVHKRFLPLCRACYSTCEGGGAEAGVTSGPRRGQSASSPGFRGNHGDVNPWTSQWRRLRDFVQHVQDAHLLTYSKLRRPSPEKALYTMRVCHVRPVRKGLSTQELCWLGWLGVFAVCRTLNANLSLLLNATFHCTHMYEILRSNELVACTHAGYYMDKDTFVQPSTLVRTIFSGPLFFLPDLLIYIWNRGDSNCSGIERKTFSCVDPRNLKKIAHAATTAVSQTKTCEILSRQKRWDGEKTQH